MRLYPALARNSAAAALLAFSLATPAIAAGPAPAAFTAATASAPDTSKIRIDNFGRVDQTYFRGGQPQGQDYADLAAVGIKTIINLTSDDAQANERQMAMSAGMAYVQIPMTTHQSPTAAQLAQFLQIVNDPSSQPVYVHCVGGRHRTGVMTAAYRISQDGWTADRAFSEMKQFKFGADFLHAEFKDFVYAYRPVVAAATRPVAALATKTGG